jgi:hypothetical protein
MEEIIKQWSEKLNQPTTKGQYLIISNIMAQRGLSISPEECKDICNMQRECRRVLAKDETSAELEKAWHMPDYIRPDQYQDKLFNLPITHN